ncbi:hypothetical protein [Mesorhizobium sp. M0276]|uniref:hypothetical protein n=1 Tax=Mesorhizobium sp. M0276 TaxID=2956928 RepID=UPI00333865DC
MTNKPGKSTSDAVIQRLVHETGITEEQARDLVSILGITLWSSLVREARLLNRSV